MADHVRTTRRDDVLVVEIDNPPVNALGPGVPEALAAAIEAGERAGDVAAIVVKGAGRTFVAGADIKMLERLAWGEAAEPSGLLRLIRRVEDCAKPVVMALHGHTLGGGLELAMAGHARIAAPDAELGQPEVALGIIPGAEGTQRLPRLVGVERALDMCVTGRSISAADALASGVVDELAAGDLTESAVAFARRVAGSGPPVRTRDRRTKLGTTEENTPLFHAARRQAARVKRGQDAPPRAIEAIEAATTMAFEDGCRRERELFLECVRGEQAKALMHVFFAERAAVKLPDTARASTPLPIRTVAIVGAGTMGTGIAMAAANGGLDVCLTDVTAEAIDAGMAAIRSTYARSVQRGSLAADAMADRLARIRPGRAYDGFGSADLVIEAVFEDLAVKQEVFRDLDRVARPGCLLASNTSTLDIDALAAVTSRPDMVLGLHFFSPAAVMRLVEIVRGRATGAGALATASAFARGLRKLGVIVGNGPGFVGNRLFFPYAYEAQFLVEEGTTPAAVDRALTDFGWAMGIFAVDDLAGLDVGWRIRRELGHFTSAGARTPLVADRLVEMGRFGQKRGRGWYRYNEPRVPTPDPEVDALIGSLSAAAGIPQRSILSREIVERCLFALVNEGARVLEEGLARRASDIDVIYLNGYGFPAWRGGPMFYADRVGLGVVLDRVTAWHREHGERWRPAPLLVELARAGRTFRDRDGAVRT